MKQVFNPFLPLNEYIPDGEPHVFGDRVYVYGSHEEAGSDTFCNLDYAVWSAPIDNLKDWKCEGTSYRAKQDPLYGESLKYMYAPDVVQGNDGKYYLYYCMAGYRGGGGYGQPISVAVSDNPAGPFSYLGFVKNPDGSVFGEYVTFDPALINDDGTVRLYYGTHQTFPEMRSKINAWQIDRIIAKIYNKSIDEVKALQGYVDGPCTVELENDMLTVKGHAKRILPRRQKGTEYYDHAFFEGSSIRKIRDTYYFIYSSQKNHELCYATSKYPDRDFVYRGIIISNGDVGLDGRKDKDRLNFTGTNHGSIEKIGEKWYVFYHRLTHKSNYSRQACAEEINILPDGSIPQAAMTSCGLNGSPLCAEGEYPAAIACNLTNGKMPHVGNAGRNKKVPFIVEKDGMNYIADITKGTRITFKYFSFLGQSRLTVYMRGNAKGKMNVYIDDTLQGTFIIEPSESWKCYSIPIHCSNKADLTFVFAGKGNADFLKFSFERMNSKKG